MDYDSVKMEIIHQEIARLLDLQDIAGIKSHSREGFALTKVLEFIKELNTPSNHSLRALQVVFAFNLIICISCLTIIFLQPRGKCYRVWVVKKLYITDSANQMISSSPLYLLNSGFTMSISQLFGSISTQVYIWTLYKIYKDPQRISKPNLFICNSLMFSFEFFAYWVMAWSSLYTRLCSSTTYAARIKMQSRRAIHPLAYNVFFITFPVVVLLCHLIVIYVASRYFVDQLNMRLIFHKLLHSGYLIWEKFDSSKSQQSRPDLINEILALNHQLEELSLALFHHYRLLLSIIQFTCAYWGAIMVITCSFLAYSLWKLISALRRNIINREKSIISNKGISNTNLLSNAEGEGPTIKPRSKLEVISDSDHHSVRVKRRIDHLAIRGGALVFSALVTIAYCFTGAFDLQNTVKNPNLRTLADWFPIVSGTSSALPIIFQCWRMYCDKDKLIFDCPKTNLKNAIALPNIKDPQLEESILRITCNANVSR
ncbi:hypothetical protein BY996DRAFT_921567 [Phakopsora pachyrhizi]|uniref:Expressed protein n=1 Tax=Phakopsora pachyrhizi TaxID=170000 RepID=A0AAV0BS81_PHAPC|nr:hypothetical protein BY996DRAFT_921567 [Phakopsora pachyrhizi]CAH7689099.1 expressed protein [Phakopsora pachyrhizi]